ncbi:nuclear RNA export factor 2 [Scaptodrosophila lebanonensis]|uniref:Nuclear RNA export factor 2 n=1 Tax=Drosophila lebanonensis TaxID=7225 RepID=A0A6J2TXA6_DROLE|nr:nuclear RNA export factor 2 [Scaptodrosophila lebanonensis]
MKVKMSKRRIIYFDGRVAPINLEYNDPKIYSQCKNYDQSGISCNWHEFRINHNGLLNYLKDSTETILNILFAAVDGEEFYPVAYQAGTKFDTFLARACRPALDKLFAQGLKLRGPSGATVPITVQFNVAAFEQNQISPQTLISQVVNRLMDSLEQHGGISNILNLRDFSSKHYFRDVVVRLSNAATFTHLCNAINQNDRFCAVNGLILASNGIRSLKPLQIFGRVEYALLDLSNNRIRSVKQLCEDLANIKANELKLENNPIMKEIGKSPDCLKPLMYNFKLVDGDPIDKMYKNYNPFIHEINVQTNGERIDKTNMPALQLFKDSPDWHAFMIPDPKREFSKDVIFDYLFISVDQTLSEFYPCYYIYQQQEHRFLVRNCFDQIHNLVNNCSLELKIPNLVDTDDMPQIIYDRSISFYLLMNVCTFKKRHLDVNSTIEEALQKRYNAMNRVLDLEQFQQDDTLKNVVVHMSSPKITHNILTIASRKFISNCSEIRMCNNKIVSLLSARPLSLLISLQALDLGHNWISDLTDIKSLRVLHLKSLRLHGNRLCNAYRLPCEYIAAVKEHFPHLTKLDGVDLGSKPGLAPQKNFLVNTAAYELVGLLFLNTFLREFENLDDRYNLEKFYTDHTIFTMTCTCTANRDTSSTHKAAINKFTAYARCEKMQPGSAIHFGWANILHIYMKLPNVKHDFSSLQTDVMHYDSKSAVIYVTGVLRDAEPEKANVLQGEPLILAFSRQFILKVDAEGQGICGRARRYKITNERLNIMKASTKQTKTSFKLDAYFNNGMDVKDEEESVDVKEHKLLLFQEITGLLQVWCTRCLEDANWNFEEALKNFLKMEASNELSDNSFL